jgi:hypothetical protein
MKTIKEIGVFIIIYIVYYIDKLLTFLKILKY